VTNNAPLSLIGATVITLSGLLTDNGSIDLSSSNSISAINCSGGTVTGTGTFYLGQGLNAARFNYINGSLTQDAQHVITGTGIVTAALVNYGSVISSGYPYALTLSGATTNYGTFQASNSSYFNLAGGALTNIVGQSLVGGTYEVDAGCRMNLSGSTAITQNAAHIILNGTPLAFPTITPMAAVTPAGEFDLRSGAVFTTVGDFSSAGIVNIDSSSTLNINGAMSQIAGATQVDGLLNVSSGTFALQGGTLKGIGEINASLFNTGGVVSPGDSPGTLSDTGAFNQSGGGELLIEIAGFSKGQYGVMSVNGSAMLNGTLDIVLLNGFVPTMGERFTILSATGPVTGQFSNIIAPPNINVIYNASSVVLTAVPEPASTFMLGAAIGLLSLRKNAKHIRTRLSSKPTATRIMIQ
jgi:hypothetical protein